MKKVHRLYDFEEEFIPCQDNATKDFDQVFGLRVGRGYQYVKPENLHDVPDDYKVKSKA